VLASGCSERLPRPIEQRDAAAPAPVYGLDTRPVSTTCAARPWNVSRAVIGFEKVTPVAFDTPVDVVTHAGKIYVLELGGKLQVLSADRASTSLVADLGPRIVSGGEAGLLGMAFHPRFAQNRFVFLYYTAPHSTQPPPAGITFQSVLARYESPDGGATLDLSTEKRIMVVDQPFANHNGGTISFGNDGFLYWALGDGGSGGDPLNAAQDKTSLLGKIVRVDVDGGDPYAVPPSNPFAAGGGRSEIYALGLRNPYRFSFDAPTGDLWLGDVGQGAREEIDKIVLGGNYGWKIREGKTCFQAATCDATGLLDPLVEHGRDEAVAIVGGVVYRGTKVPLLTGHYVYGDAGLGTFFAFPAAEPAPLPTRIDQDAGRARPSAFALDPAGEIIFTDLEKGALLRIVPPVPLPEMPTKLSLTGCTDPLDPTKPASGLFPYDVVVPSWSDGATAVRYLALPADTRLEEVASRLWLPHGGVALRFLRAEDRPVEVQMLLRRPDGSWSAYTYAWDADGRDATLVERDGATVRLPSGRNHRVVGRATCNGCHDLTTGPMLGLEVAQLDRTFAFPAGRSANILDTLDHLGMIERPVPRRPGMVLYPVDGYAAVEQRARSYLHVNCGFCHEGPHARPADMTLAYYPRDFGQPSAAPVPIGGAGICDVVATSALPGLAGRRRLAPGDPAASAIPLTMRATDAARMPPGTTVVDDEGAALVDAWIGSLRDCGARP